MEAADADSQWKGRRAQPFLIRLAHWLNIPLLLIMAGSGLQIFSAYPALGARGALYGWYPWQGKAPPTWLRFGGWLAGARHWHFALGWFLIGNGIIYLIYMGARGEWRRRMFLPGRDSRNAVLMMAYYLRLQGSTADRLLQRPSAAGVQFRHPPRAGRGPLGPGDLQARSTLVARSAVRRLR